MGRIFGTDGVRGVAGVELTAQLAMDLAVAAVPVLAPVAAALGHARRPSAVIGRDSRASGDFLEAAVVAGLASSGVDVLRLGIIPTPGVAYLTGALNADFGVVLSASHNPAADNGIKFFGRAGVKLPDEAEDAIEARLRAIGGGSVRSGAGDFPALGFGRVTDAYSAHEAYLDHLLARPGSGPPPRPPRPPPRRPCRPAPGAPRSGPSQSAPSRVGPPSAPIPATARAEAIAVA